MMRSVIITAILILIFPSLVLADQLEDGKAAFDRGAYRTAFEQLQLSAEKGDAESQYDIGVIYEHGWGGVKQDFSKAMKWLLKASDQGCLQANYHIANLYDHGLGVPQDREKASYWILKKNLHESENTVPCKYVGFPPSNYKPPNGVIPNQITAVQVAEAILKSIYGEDVIKREEPFTASLDNDTWTVIGQLPKAGKGHVMVGGIATIQLSRTDGRVIRISHDQ